MHDFDNDNILGLIGVSLETGSNATGVTLPQETQFSPGGGAGGGWSQPWVVLPYMKYGDLLSYIRNEDNVSFISRL